MALVPSPFSPGSLLGAGFEPFATLHREMNRLFDDVLRGAPSGASVAGASAGAPAARGEVLMAPSIEVTETDSEVRMRAELPGVDEKEVEVSLHDDVLTLRAEKRQERKEEREGVHFSERAFGTFQRSLRLPFVADPDQVRARMENGVLTVTLPKSQAKDRNRRIQIQGAQKTGAAAGGAQQVGGPAEGSLGGTQAGGQATGSPGVTQAGGQATGGQVAGSPGVTQAGGGQAAGAQGGGQQADGQQAPGGYTTGSDGGTQSGSGPTGSGGDDQRPETTETMVPGVSGVSEDGAPGAL